MHNMPIKDCRIVFLHIPKTAGQTIHSELARLIGNDAVSPIRVHTQANTAAGQLPPGYRLYSGHIDWLALDTVSDPRFVFTVLRDPFERIASFYFFLKRQAESLSTEELAHPRRVGMRRILDSSVDDYFCGGPASWRRFIRDHYHSPYCAYLATRTLRGYSKISQCTHDEMIARAVTAAKSLSGVYSMNALGALERDIEVVLGQRPKLKGRYMNVAPKEQSGSRWMQLEAMIEKRQTLMELNSFVEADLQLMSRLGMTTD
jgi:hypothetical protein